MRQREKEKKKKDERDKNQVLYELTLFVEEQKKPIEEAEDTYLVEQTGLSLDRIKTVRSWLTSAELSAALEVKEPFGEDFYRNLEREAKDVEKEERKRGVYRQR